MTEDNSIQRLFPGAACANGTLSVRGPDMATRLPELLQALQAAGCPPGNLHVRAVTLEDVFLALTGRALRE